MRTNWVAVAVAAIIVGVVLWLSVTQIREQHLKNDPMLYKVREKIDPLFSNGLSFTGDLEYLNDRNVLSEVEFFWGDKSYTINKEKIYLCLVDEKGDYYDLNTLVYVVLHELSHVLCDEIGHTEKFHYIFKELLQQADKAGVYDPSVPIIANYCMY